MLASVYLLGIEKSKKESKKTKPVAEIISEPAPAPQSPKVDESRITTTKRRRVSLDGTAVATAITVERAKGHEKEKRKMNTPFQRIKSDQVTYHDERLKDNTFVARVSVL
jgi:hypothetical protein